MKNTGKIYNEQEWQGINTSDFIYEVHIDNCSVTISEYTAGGIGTYTRASESDNWEKK